MNKLNICLLLSIITIIVIADDDWIYKPGSSWEYANGISVDQNQQQSQILISKFIII
jgi:hypothetical protein